MVLIGFWYDLRYEFDTLWMWGCDFDMVLLCVWPGTGCRAISPRFFGVLICFDMFWYAFDLVLIRFWCDFEAILVCVWYMFNFFHNVENHDCKARPQINIINRYKPNLNHWKTSILEASDLITYFGTSSSQGRNSAKKFFQKHPQTIVTSWINVEIYALIISISYYTYVLKLINIYIYIYLLIYKDGNEPSQSNSIKQIHKRGETLEKTTTTGLKLNAYMLCACWSILFFFSMSIIGWQYFHPWFLFSSCYCWSQGD